MNTVPAIFIGDAGSAAARAIALELALVEKPWQCPVASTPREPGTPFLYPEPDEEIDIGVGMSTSGKVHIYLYAGGQRVAANFPLDWAETIRDRLDETIRACKREKNTP